MITAKEARELTQKALTIDTVELESFKEYICEKIQGSAKEGFKCVQISYEFKGRCEPYVDVIKLELRSKGFGVDGVNVQASTFVVFEVIW